MEIVSSPGTLIVTGASRGIGAATAVLVGQRGWAVAVNHRGSAPEAAGVVAATTAAGAKAMAIQADVSQKDHVVRPFETAEQELGPVRGLVNNAGVTGGFARTEDVTLAAAQAGMLAIPRRAAA